MEGARGLLTFRGVEEGGKPWLGIVEGAQTISIAMWLFLVWWVLSSCSGQIMLYEWIS